MFYVVIICPNLYEKLTKIKINSSWDTLYVQTLTKFTRQSLQKVITVQKIDKS